MAKRQDALHARRCDGDRRAAVSGGTIRAGELGSERAGGGPSDAQPGSTFDVTLESSDEEFAAESPRHPVLEVLPISSGDEEPK
jgi:hypothetical protein